MKDSVISGDGRPDMILIPMRSELPTVVFELRIARTEKDYEHSFMAVDRIEHKGYLRGMEGKTVQFGIMIWKDRQKVSMNITDDYRNGGNIYDLQINP